MIKKKHPFFFLFSVLHKNIFTIPTFVCSLCVTFRSASFQSWFLLGTFMTVGYSVKNPIVIPHVAKSVLHENMIRINLSTLRCTTTIWVCFSWGENAITHGQLFHHEMEKYDLDISLFEFCNYKWICYLMFKPHWTFGTPLVYYNYCGQFYFVHMTTNKINTNSSSWLSQI